MISDYDCRVLAALNRIQNGDKVKPKDLTSWIVVKKIDSNRGSELENSSVIHSLKKMNELGLVNLSLEKKTEKKIRKAFSLNEKNVSFEEFKINGVKKKVIKCIINDKIFIREL